MNTKFREYENILKEVDATSFSDIYSKYNLIKKLDLPKELFKGHKEIKIAVLGTSTLSNIKPVLDIKCRLANLNPTIEVCEYNQYEQIIINETSWLYEMKPDIVILSIDVNFLLKDKFFFFNEMDETKKEKILSSIKNHIINLVEFIKKRNNSFILINNLEIPAFSNYGILENKQKNGLINSLKKLNLDLNEIFLSDKKTFVCDYDLFCSKIGKLRIKNNKLFYLADISVDQNFLPLLAEDYMGYIKAIKGLSKKCIVLDLDNTLWGGIVGEDGLDGIKLGPDVEGKPFMDFQKYLLSLFNRGIILAINSKNNLEDAMEVIKNHPYMVLKEENFASIRINWNDKATNLIEIAKEINVGTDSLIFIDDDPMNRDLVKEELPEVEVIDLPKDPSDYLDSIINLNNLNTLEITQEDRNRGKIYGEQRLRNEVLESSVNIDEFIKKLNMEIQIKPADSFTIPRIAQLINKTNQFNMTTRRHDLSEVEKLNNNKNFEIFGINVKDKYGDNGLVGVVLIKLKDNESLEIDNFLLSCRVLGRKTEHSIINYLINHYKSKGYKSLSASFIATKKNKPASNFYEDFGFDCVKKLKSQIKEDSFDKEFELKLVDKDVKISENIKIN